MRKIIVVGAGGHGCSVAEAAMLSGQYKVVGFVDDGRTTKPRLGIPILGSFREIGTFQNLASTAIVAIGNNTVREDLSNSLLSLGFDLATVIHPSAIIAPSALIGAGTAVMAKAVVGTEATLGFCVILNAAAVADHHVVIEDFGHLGVSACMAGGAVLRRGAWLQAGCSLGYGVEVASGRVLPPGTALG